MLNVSIIRILIENHLILLIDRYWIIIIFDDLSLNSAVIKMKIWLRNPKFEVIVIENIALVLKYVRFSIKIFLKIGIDHGFYSTEFISKFTYMKFKALIPITIIPTIEYMNICDSRANIQRILIISEFRRYFNGRPNLSLYSL